MNRLLILRSEPGASATIAKARDCGLEAVSVPLFTMESVAWTPPEPAQFDGLLLTSASALRLAGEQLQRYRSLQVYAVGQATADAARDAGFDIAAAGDAGVDRLLGSIEPDLKLLHLCGEDRRSPTLTRQDISAVVVYRARKIDVPDLPELMDSIVLVHSPRAGQRFAELVKRRSAIAVAAISSAAADAVGEGWRSVDVAHRPTDDELLALAASLCKNPQSG